MSFHLHCWLPDLNLARQFAPTTLVLPHLSRCLSRADMVTWAHTDDLAGLSALFNLATDSPPIAALSYLADTQTVPSGHWLRVDPVYLHADRDSVRLFDAAQALSDLDDITAQQFISSLNTFYAEEGWQFHAPTARRWYVRLPEQPQVTFPALTHWLGRDIRDAHVTGDAARWWRQRSTELQMFLHQHPQNQQRITQQQMPINHLWFWGAGVLTEPTTQRWQQVWSDEVWVNGLASHNAIPTTAPPPDFTTALAAMQAQGDYLLTLTMPTNIEPQQWLQQLEYAWFTPLLNGLRQRQLAQVVIYAGTQHAFHLTQAGVRRWWRKTTTWQAQLQRCTA